METKAKQNNETKVTLFIMGGVWAVVDSQTKEVLTDCQDADELVKTCNKNAWQVENKGCFGKAQLLAY